MKDKILKILEEKHVKSGGHCGTYAPIIKKELKIEFSELKNYLNELYKEGKIQIKDGAHGKLIFIKYGK